MANFRVTISKAVGGTIKNPFARIHIGLNDKTTRLCRTWDFEAKDEKEVRKLFAEAQEQRIPNVMGFVIDSIKRLDAS